MRQTYTAFTGALRAAHYTCLEPARIYRLHLLMVLLLNLQAVLVFAVEDYLFTCLPWHMPVRCHIWPEGVCNDRPCVQEPRAYTAPISSLHNTSHFLMCRELGLPLHSVSPRPVCARLKAVVVSNAIVMLGNSLEHASTWLPLGIPCQILALMINLINLSGSIQVCFCPPLAVVRKHTHTTRMLSTSHAFWLPFMSVYHRLLNPCGGRLENSMKTRWFVRCEDTLCLALHDRLFALFLFPCFAMFLEVANDSCGIPRSRSNAWLTKRLHICWRLEPRNSAQILWSSQPLARILTLLHAICRTCRIQLNNFPPRGYRMPDRRWLPRSKVVSGAVLAFCSELCCFVSVIPGCLQMCSASSHMRQCLVYMRTCQNLMTCWKRACRTQSPSTCLPPRLGDCDGGSWLCQSCKVPSSFSVDRIYTFDGLFWRGKFSQQFFFANAWLLARPCASVSNSRMFCMFACPVYACDKQLAAQLSKFLICLQCSHYRVAAAGTQFLIRWLLSPRLPERWGSLPCLTPEQTFMILSQST